MTRGSAEPPTLFAPASAPGRAAVACVRLSGPRAAGALAALAAPVPPPRRLSRRTIRHPVTADVIDDALVVLFPAPHSFTGEDVVEFHVHGGLVPTRRLLDALAELDGLAPAAPGEFSRRAFLNGRLDLAQAEAVADLVDAETEAQARQALRQLDGVLGRQVRAWQAHLMALRVPLEASLDFADESDVGAAAAADDAIAELASAIAEARADAGGERLRAGLRVALVGPPNAGKSSLLNALARRDAAIVSAEPGTTRDVLEVALELDGLPLTVVDTAGLRETAEGIEAEGIRRARAAAAAADLTVYAVDGARWPVAETPAVAADVLLLTKADLGPAAPHALAERPLLPVSVTSPGGVEPLVRALTDAARARLGQGAAGLWTRARHREALARAAAELRAAAATPDPVLRAESLRLASRALGTLTGEGGVEALLDGIFGAFCIGK